MPLPSRRLVKDRSMVEREAPTHARRHDPQARFTVTLVNDGRIRVFELNTMERTMLHSLGWTRL